MTNTARILDFNKHKAIKEDIPVIVTTTTFYSNIDEVVRIYYLDDVFDTIPIYNPFVYKGLNLSIIKQTVARQGWYKKLYCDDNGNLLLEIKVEKTQ